MDNINNAQNEWAADEPELRRKRRIRRVAVRVSVALLLLFFMVYGVVCLIGNIVRHFAPKESVSEPEKVKAITESDTPPPEEEPENAFSGLYLPRPPAGDAAGFCRAAHL